MISKNERWNEALRVVRLYSWELVGRRVRGAIYSIRLWHLNIVNEDTHELDEALEIHDFIESEKTRLWLRRAWTHHLKRPPEGEMYWTEGFIEHKRQLTNEGIRFILDQYREEKGARREAIVKWATLVFAAVAALGVIAKL